MDSEVAKRRAQYAQAQFGRELQTLFTSDCKFRSLFSRVNRCLKDYFNSTFAPVNGMRVNHSPTLKIEVPFNCVAFDNQFNGSWGGQGGVHNDLFMSFRDGLREKFTPNQVPNFEPRDDTMRVPLGQEFSYSFSNGSFKRPRAPSNCRITPDGKGRFNNQRK